MPKWLKRLLVWHGHLVLWSVALIALFWLMLVLTLQFLGSRPQSLYALAEMAGVQLTMGQFSAQTRPLAASVDIVLDKVQLSWEGGSLEIDHLAGDINLWNMLIPDLAVGKQMQISQLKLTLDTNSQTAANTNPLATPWLRLWENTHIQNSQVVWRADAPWMMDAIDVQLTKAERWRAQFEGVMHYPGWPATPVKAQATIDHQFGFNPKVKFEGTALPGDMVLLGQRYNFKFGLLGNWSAESLQADLRIDASSETEAGQQLVHHALGQVHSDDLLMWDMSVQQLSVGGESIDLPVWPRLTVHPQTGAVLSLNQVGLTPDGNWLKSMPKDVQQTWQLWRPELWLNQLSLHWGADGSLNAIRGGIDLLRWTPTQGMPGMDLRQLTFDYRAHDGLLAIVPQGDSKMLWQFANGKTLPVKADPLVLRLHPESPFTDWSLPSWQVHFGDVALSVIADVHADKPMQLQLDVTANQFADLLPLVPMEHLSAPLQKFLSNAFKAGREIKGSLRFNGHLSQLLAGTFTDDNLSLNAQVKEMALQYDPAYPLLTHADALLSWHNDRLLVEIPSATVNGAQVTSAKAEILYLPNDQIALRLNGLLNADMAQVQSFLLASPLAQEIDVVDLLKQSTLSGAVTGKLSLWLPLEGFEGVQAKPRIRGMLRMQSTNLKYGFLSVEQLSGKLLVSESGLDASHLVGQWQGGKVNGSVTSLDKGRIAIKIDAATPMDHAGISEGVLDWRTDVVILPDGAIEVKASGDQTRLAIVLPEPFVKKRNEKNAWKLQGRLSDGMLQGHFSDEKWRLDVGLKNDRNQWQWQKLFLVPRAHVDAAPSANIAVQLPRLSVDDWLTWREANASEDTFPLPAQGDVAIEKLTFADQTFEQVQAQWQIADNETSVKMQSPHLSGRWTSGAEADHLSFDTLRWQRRVKSAAEKLIEPLPVCRQPSQKPWHPLHLAIASLNLETLNQGVSTSIPVTQIKAFLMQDGQVRHIKAVELQSASLHATGNWAWNLADNQSTLLIQARADKAADMSALWGLDQVVSGGSADIEAMLNWTGGLDCFDTRLLLGDLKLRADDGALSDTSPGLARLFGLLSFDAFTRRLKIGLGDVVNKGLAFDKIEATAHLSKGLLQLNQLQLDGPSVRMLLKGNTDLIAEEHDLTAAVTPLVGDSIPTMALLSGVSPITAIGVYLLQKIVPPLSGNLFTFDYRITGGWQAPVLTEVVGE